jgi:hypothetical protein
VSLLVVPTIAGGGPGMHTASMASSSDPPADDDRPSSPVWRHIDTLEVTQIVLAILEAQKTMPWATAATVSRKKHDDAIHVCVTMRKSPQAASAGQPAAPGGPSGRSEVIAAFAVRRLGEDLAKAFGDSDVITLK